MFVESQVSRFKSDKWRLLSFSSLTISSSWIQDPRSKISSRSWPRNLGSRGACWIQDPGSKISRGSWPRNLGSVDPRFPKKSLWASWILDLGSWLAGSKISQEESLGILDLGSWLAPWLAGSKISQEEFLSWLARSKISQEESLGILDLGSWILACGIQDFTMWESREVGTLGSLDPKSEHGISSLNLGSQVPTPDLQSQVPFEKRTSIT